METTATITRSPINNVPDGMVPGSRRWNVQLRHDGRSMGTPFYTGPGLGSRPPSVADVLECLAADASSVVNSRSFEEWAAELGENPDSRKAHKLYMACVRQTERLQELLGPDFDAVVFPED